MSELVLLLGAAVLELAAGALVDGALADELLVEGAVLDVLADGLLEDASELLDE